MNFFWDKINKQETNEAMVLMYHRVADVVLDPWDLCVSPENFEQHILHLTRKFEIISMHHLVERIRKEQTVKNLVAITFDDGYLDNYTTARPILEKYKVPATFYLTCKFLEETENHRSLIIHPNSYWWDELQQIIFHTPELPEYMEIEVNDTTLSFHLGDDCRLSETDVKQISEWRYGTPFYNNRPKLFCKLSDALKTMPAYRQAQIMQTIKQWAGVENILTPELMNESQIKDLATNDDFEIGGHSANHPALTYLPNEEQKEEIEINKKFLESLILKNIRGFAYPHGNFNRQTQILLKTSGFYYAVSTTEKNAGPASDLYDIPRHQVKNFNSLDFSRTIRQWQRALTTEP